MADSTLPLLPAFFFFPHLRWTFVFQRPQHLLSRFARERRVFFFEEPILDEPVPRLDIQQSKEGVFVAVPHLAPGTTEEEAIALQRQLVDAAFAGEAIDRYTFWYYTPMALPFTRHLKPLAVAYDCMDELSGFKGAHPALLRRERELLERADLVTTG